MGTPQNYQEYLWRFHQNQRVSGYGLDTTTHIPCPFCAAPDFKVFKVLAAEQAMDQSSTCDECERTLSTVVVKSEDGHSTSISLYQTGGPEQPDWLSPKIPKARDVGR
jgi:hypothetical protein